MLIRCVDIWFCNFFWQVEITDVNAMMIHSWIRGIRLLVFNLSPIDKLTNQNDGPFSHTAYSNYEIIYKKSNDITTSLKNPQNEQTTMLHSRMPGNAKSLPSTEHTFPKELPGTFQLLADASGVERCAQVRDVHVYIRTPRQQNLHATKMSLTGSRWGIQTFYLQNISLLYTETSFSPLEIY